MVWRKIGLGTAATCVAFTLSWIIGCASPGAVGVALEQVKPGFDKSAVLDSAGSPTRTFREAGQDHWVYIYSKDQKQWLRSLIFEDGRVLKVTSPVASTGANKTTWVKELEEADSMEEFERKVREHQPRDTP